MCSTTRRAVMTLEGGIKTEVILTIPNPSLLRFPGEMEARLVREWNKSQPNAVHKAVGIHILRN